MPIESGLTISHTQQHRTQLRVKPGSPERMLPTATRASSDLRAPTVQGRGHGCIAAQNTGFQRLACLELGGFMRRQHHLLNIRAHGGWNLKNIRNRPPGATRPPRGQLDRLSNAGQQTPPATPMRGPNVSKLKLDASPTESTRLAETIQTLKHKLVVASRGHALKNDPCPGQGRAW